jgi:hypothetical protein
MDQQQFIRICELLGDIMRKLEYIEMQVEDNGRQSIQFLRKRRELKLEENRRAYERQHGVIEISSEGEDEID